MARFERRTSALELLWRGLEWVPSANADIEGEGVMEDLRMVGEISKQRRLLAQFVRRAQSKLTSDCQKGALYGQGSERVQRARIADGDCLRRGVLAGPPGRER